MPHIPLSGRVALVTGAGTRVGAAIARSLAAAGADLVVHYATSAAGADAVVDEARALGRRATALQADLHDREALAGLARAALDWSSGRLDLLVHNAANFDRVPPAELSAEAWDRAMALNATAPYLLTLELAPALRACRGSVVAIACVSAERPWKNYLPYSVSKAALAHLVRGLAVALAPDVRVNGVAPGTVLPPLSSSDEATLARLRERIPLRRIGEAGDVARAVVFLAENDFITGQVLAVDGGASVA
ncbi:3-ketoacyl-ACP reductase [Sorangium cellulosum]|uniref:3-ketoacyl-ACP reductase n=1 Tax=Sorangium cellulosum TaxID=56 RepID=A0A2L0FAK6_SORCE|nr:SDR family oxidoreductase [Sorangium cellulosum]AUX48594.1 3-ketoacyl-ACP reductase [Sorangium cellulosum]